MAQVTEYFKKISAAGFEPAFKLILFLSEHLEGQLGPPLVTKKCMVRKMNTHFVPFTDYETKCAILLINASVAPFHRTRNHSKPLANGISCF